MSEEILELNIYLMVKTHNVTKLKYLCKTVRADYIKYPGSGIRWTNHLKVHGKNISTELIRVCKSVDELIEWGRYYSDLWGVVESDEWANLKPEEGQGFATGKHNPMKNTESKKKHLDTISRPDVKQKQRDNLKLSLATPETKARKSKSSYEVSQRPEVRAARLKYLSSDEFKNKMSGDNSPAKRPEVKEKRREYMKTDKNPSKNPDSVKKRYGPESKALDHTVYTFINSNGDKEMCTRRELFLKYPELSQSAIHEVIKGDRTRHKGWTIINKRTHND